MSISIIPSRHGPVAASADTVDLTSLTADFDDVQTVVDVPDDTLLEPAEELLLTFFQSYLDLVPSPSHENVIALCSAVNISPEAGFQVISALMSEDDEDVLPVLAAVDQPEDDFTPPAGVLDESDTDSFVGLDDEDEEDDEEDDDLDDSDGGDDVFATLDGTSPQTQPGAVIVESLDPTVQDDDELKRALKYDGNPSPDPSPDDLAVCNDGAPETPSQQAQPPAGETLT